MKPETKRNIRIDAIIEFTEEYILKNGYSPTIMEVAQGIKECKSTIYEDILYAQSIGRLKYAYSKDRTLMPTSLEYVKIKEKDKSVLSKRLQNCYRILEQFVIEQNYIPSYREIGELLNIASPSCIQTYIEGLYSAGFIENLTEGQSRAYKLTEYAYRRKRV